MGRGFGPAPSRWTGRTRRRTMRTIRAVAVAVTTTAVMCVATTVWAEDEVPTETTVESAAPGDGGGASGTPDEATEPAPTTATTVAIAVPADDEEPVTITVDPGDTAPPPADEAADPDDEARTTTVAVDESSTTAPAPASESTVTTNAQVSQTEEIVVSGTQVAEANTGGNVTESGNTPDAGSVAIGGDIGTGEADAIGSRDVNTIDQEADVLLSGQATANIVQIALILNIGAALANSGYNMVDSEPGGSSVLRQGRDWDGALAIAARVETSGLDPAWSALESGYLESARRAGEGPRMADARRAAARRRRGVRGAAPSRQDGPRALSEVRARCRRGGAPWTFSIGPVEVETRAGNGTRFASFTLVRGTKGQS